MSDDLTEALFDPSAVDKSAASRRPVWDPEPKPDHVKASDNYDLGRALYPNGLESAMGWTLNQNITELRDHFALTADQAAAVRKQHLAWLNDIVRDGDAPRVHTLLVGHTIHPASEEQQDAWPPEMMKQVHERYGDNADRLLAKGKKLITDRPELAKAIGAAGIGNHALFVLAVIERVRDAELRGQL